MYGHFVQHNLVSWLDLGINDMALLGEMLGIGMLKKLVLKKIPITVTNFI